VAAFRIILEIILDLKSSYFYYKVCLGRIWWKSSPSLR